MKWEQVEEQKPQLRFSSLGGELSGACNGITERRITEPQKPPALFAGHPVAGGNRLIALHGFRDDSYDFNVAMITLSNSDGPGRRTQSQAAKR